MKKDFLSINRDKIISIAKATKFYDIASLRSLLFKLKEKRLVSQSLFFDAFLRRLIDFGLYARTIFINEKNITRYTFHKKFDLYELALSLKKDSFLSMSSALNFQKLSSYRNQFIFVSKELSKKEEVTSKLLQKNIDNAFKKPYRRTHSVGTVEDKYIVLLSPKNTSAYGVIEYKGLRVSSIDRALVEMIVNVQYFRNSQEIIDNFKPLKNKINIDEVFKVVEHFDFIYPYYQCVGFYLDQIGFKKEELAKFKDMVFSLKFYTDKAKEEYRYDKYWKMYY